MPSLSERREYWTFHTRTDPNAFVYSVEQVYVGDKLVRERDVGNRTGKVSRWYLPDSASFNVVERTPYRKWERVKCRGKIKRLIGLEEWPPD